ncbi:MAG: dual specificity protein phosphatase family protein [Planctomycetes bacterium]|nr:dual specificity protein phosphatase family protein [Planctomycetota bacterium]
MSQPWPVHRKPKPSITVQKSPAPERLSPASTTDSQAGHEPRPAAQPRRGRFVMWGVIAATVAALVFAERKDAFRAVRDRFVPKRWGVVEEGKIYRSGQLSRHLVKEMLSKHHIQRVVDLTFDNPQDANHTAEVRAAAELGIHHKLYPLDSDGTGDVHIYAQAVAAVADAEREGQPVLVHCYAGSQRTGGVVALYRLLVQHWSPDDVLAEMRHYKYDPHESPRLIEYLNRHVGEIASDLVAQGTIESVPEPLPRLAAK